MDATVRMEHELVAVESEGTVHAMLELATPEGGPRRPSRVALVLDRSGSMQGRPLAVVARAARWLVNRLGPDDRVALVAFDHDVHLLAGPTPPTDPRLHTALARLRPGGTTNLSGGWLKGVEQLRGGDGRGRVILLTDGLANEGVTDPRTLRRMARTVGDAGITTSTIGVGDAFDEDLLTAMADAAGGGAHFAETAEDAPGIFAAELEGLRGVVAQNVSVEVRPGPAVAEVGVLNDYPITQVEGGLHVNVGDAYAGEKRQVVFSLDLERLTEPGAAAVCELVLRYVAVGEQVSHHELVVPVVVSAVSAAEAAAATPDAQVQEEVLLLSAARARDRAVEMADDGDLDGATNMLRAARTDLDALGSIVAGSEVVDLDARIAALEESGYSAAERKRLRYEAHRRKRRRA